MDRTWQEQWMAGLHLLQGSCGSWLFWTHKGPGHCSAHLVEVHPAVAIGVDLRHTLVQLVLGLQQVHLSQHVLHLRFYERRGSHDGNGELDPSKPMKVPRLDQAPHCRQGRRNRTATGAVCRRKRVLDYSWTTTDDSGHDSGASCAFGLKMLSAVRAKPWAMPCDPVVSGTLSDAWCDALNSGAPAPLPTLRWPTTQFK